MIPTSIYEKIHALRRAMPGYREPQGFEHRFGMPPEETFYLTRMTPWQTRILAELNFLIEAAKVSDHELILPAVEQALEHLLLCQEAQGALTDQVCEEAEQKLLVAQPVAQTYELILVGHAHLDMNWMWGWEETVATVVNTFHTMLRLMEEYEHFHFSQSQASCYKIIEDYAPELMAPIRARIEEGRWEVTAAAWVETDKNMPSTESLIRHISESKRYFETTWGVDPASIKIDWSPDTFGHSAHVPMLNQRMGIPYYYHCRGRETEDVLYRWQAPSGDEVLVYKEPYWYNNGITAEIGYGLPALVERSGGLRTGMIVYGVGDHGGGPTRRDLEEATQMMAWPVFPAIRFGRVSEYFEKAETVREALPVVTSELNMLFTGCYTTQSEIKGGNKASERSLYDAELWSALATLHAGAAYPREIFVEAWQKLLFTHFHDILTGSNTHASKVYALGLYQEVMAASETRTNLALRQLSGAIRTEGDGRSEAISQAEGAGVGYGFDKLGYTPIPEQGSGTTRIFHVFNSSAQARTQVLELTVWDWTGDLKRLRVHDVLGEPCRFTLIDTSYQRYWDHRFVRVLVEVTVPGMGYTTVVLTEAKPERLPIYHFPAGQVQKPYKDVVLENEALRAVFCYQTGRLLSLVDKASGREQLLEGASGGFAYLDTEYKTSNAWNIGRHLATSTTFRLKDLTVLGTSGLRQGFDMVLGFRDSELKVRVELLGENAFLTIDAEIDWQERTVPEETVPVLAYQIPATVPEVVGDVPGGWVTRPAQAIDVPFSNVMAVRNDGRALALMSKTHYGYRATSQQMSLTLLNSAFAPDPYPEIGLRRASFALGVVNDDTASLHAIRDRWMLPLRYVSTVPHEGTLEPEGQLYETMSDHIVSGVRLEEDQLVVTTLGADGSGLKISSESNA